MPITLKDLLPILQAEHPDNAILTEEDAARFVQEHQDQEALALSLSHALQSIEDGAVFSETEIENLIQQIGGKELLDSLCKITFGPHNFRLFAPSSDYGLMESLLIAAKDNPTLQRVIARPDFSAAISMIKALPIQTFSPKNLIESLALWPAGEPLSLISDMAKSILTFYPNTIPLHLDKIITVARYPEYRRDILSADFTSWACELVPNLAFSTSSLPELCHIYGLGPEARRQALNPNFQREALRLNNILNWSTDNTEKNTDLTNRKLKKQNSFSIPSTRAMLLLLEYPLESKWTELQSFLVTHQNAADDAELYMVFSLIENNDHLKSTYEKIMADPSYGQSQAYERDPVMRSDKEGTGQERPDWTTLNPIVKFKALMLREKLDEDPQLIEMIAKLVADDVNDQVTEYGGILRLNFSKEKNGEFALVPEPQLSDSIFDGSFETADPCSFDSLFQFHLHALHPDDRQYAGPSGTYSLYSGDMVGELNQQQSALVITSTGQENIDGKMKQAFNIDLYGHNVSGQAGIVLDLGEYSATVQDYAFPDPHND